ncbi:hypothetical protein [Brevundimonas sp.]|uniref:hypothetical protein n=1 Tax=Brevundimonas sp. TaxID=1871086 RepID=UPI0035692E0D
MGRKRAAGNEDFGKYVQRRSSGILEVRFPLPEEVRYAFPDAKGRPRAAIIKSLGTTDIKLANAKAEAIKTQLRVDIRRASEARGSNDLSDYLQWLFDYDLSSFAAEEADRDAYVFVLGVPHISGAITASAEAGLPHMLATTNMLLHGVEDPTFVARSM